VSAANPSEEAVQEVANFLAEELAHHWLVSFFARRRQLWFSLLQILNTQTRSKHVVQQFLRSYVSEEQQEFALAQDEIERSSIILDSPGGRMASTVPRAVILRIAITRDLFARRVALACNGPEAWREDPHALWNNVVSTFGQRHEYCKIKRVQHYMMGFLPIAGETIYTCLTRFEQEMAAIEVESPNTLGAELAFPTYLQASLKHIPQCQAVFARMLGKNN
jgi:hypothetical protein